MSPPWGGPGYRDAEVFDLHEMRPYGVEEIMAKAREISEAIVLYVPRTSDLNQLAALAGGERIEAVHYCLERKSKVSFWVSG